MIAELPVMQCDPNCGACCGPVLCSEAEYQTVAKHVREQGIVPKRQGPDVCPFYQEGTCAVYEARPFPCRLFGHVEGMNCCKGYNVNVSPKRERRLMAQYHSEGGMRPTDYRSLHECAYGDAAFGLIARHMEIQREQR